APFGLRLSPSAERYRRCRGGLRLMVRPSSAWKPPQACETVLVIPSFALGRAPLPPTSACVSTPGLRNRRHPSLHLRRMIRSSSRARQATAWLNQLREALAQTYLVNTADLSLPIVSSMSDLAIWH